MERKCNDLHLFCVRHCVVFTWAAFSATPWTAARQASLSITHPWGLLSLMSIKSVMPSNHLILCRPLLLLSLLFPSIKVFSNESALHIRWPKYWSFSFSISPSNEYSGLVSFRIDWLISLTSKGLLRVFPNITVWRHQFFNCISSSVLSLFYCPALTSIHNYRKTHSIA